MGNIVVPEAASWTELETERNLKTLEEMGLDNEVAQVKKLRSSAKRKGEDTDPGVHLAGTADEKGKK